MLNPKTGLTEQALVEIITAFVEGGVDFIKEDEIMSNRCLFLKTLIDVCTTGVEGSNVVYCYCINSDPLHILDRVKMVADGGGNGVHVNFWSGHGVYKSINELGLPNICTIIEKLV